MTSFLVSDLSYWLLGLDGLQTFKDIFSWHEKGPQYFETHKFIKWITWYTF